MCSLFCRFAVRLQSSCTIGSWSSLFFQGSPIY
uniref:Uncharacterized protein n=1 Tax=Anguilla anguilla TaxID=7936 RepID=A0A0E9QFB1_ANGAN